MNLCIHSLHSFCSSSPNLSAPREAEAGKKAGRQAFRDEDETAVGRFQQISDVTAVARDEGDRRRSFLAHSDPFLLSAAE